MMRTLASKFLFCLVSFSVATAGLASTVREEAAARVRIHKAYGKLPLQFEPNRGQADSRIRFLSRGSGYSLRLTSTGSVLALHKPRPAVSARSSQPGPVAMPPAESRGTVVQMSLLGANPAPKATGAERLRGTVSSFIGKDPKKWRRNIPTYGMVRYEAVYPGIDLLYYGSGRRLEYDFIVAPGADPARVALSFKGIDRLRLDSRGDLVLGSAGDGLRLRRPVIYQMVEGRRRPVAGGYRIEGKRQLGFQIAAYDTTKSLVIDPVLVYSTYLGGSGLENSTGIGVDAFGNAFVTGFTDSVDFPTSPGSLNATFGGGPYDAFVTKLDPSGSAIVYSTYLGGSEFDIGNGIAVDAAGNAYVVGSTQSHDFPATPGAFMTSFPGDLAVFITKLDPTGSALVYSTFLAGNGADFGNGIAIDAAGNAYVAGNTLSGDFPVTPGAFSTTFNSAYDGFVAKVDSAGATLVYSTFLGGSGSGDQCSGIAVDSEGNAYVTGVTDSPDFPTTPGAFSTAPGGLNDAFVTKVSPDGSALVYSTYLAGTASEWGTSIGVDGSGNAWVTGLTNSDDFPTTPGAWSGSRVGERDLFVTKLNASGSALVSSTYLGGSGDEAPPGPAIAVDSTGNAFVALGTYSLDFPTTPDAVSTASSGAPDAAVAEFDSTGALVYATYLTGDGPDGGTGIALDSVGGVYVTGGTYSSNFPTTAGVFQSGPTGGSDAFATKLTLAAVTPAPTNPPTTPTLTPTGQLPTETHTPTNTPTATPTQTTTNSPTTTSTRTPTRTNTVTVTKTSTPTVTPTRTPTRTSTNTPTSTRTSTPTMTNTNTRTRTSTPTVTPTLTETTTPTVTPTNTPVPRMLTALGPANVWVGLKNSDDVGLRLDLLAEVFVNSTKVGEGQVNNVGSGSSGFNNAILNAMPFSLAPSVLAPGDALRLRISARRTCSGTGHASGTARLWYNGQPIDTGSGRDAGSRFDATIGGGSSTFYLVPGFSLSTTAGSSRTSIDSFVNSAAPCPSRPFTAFGTWSATP